MCNVTEVQDALDIRFNSTEPMIGSLVNVTCHVTKMPGITASPTAIWKDSRNGEAVVECPGVRLHTSVLSSSMATLLRWTQVTREYICVGRVTSLRNDIVLKNPYTVSYFTCM
jgi:hypothetical protein